MVERFSLSEDESRLDYEIVITEPQNLVEPAVWEGTWAWVPAVRVHTSTVAPPAKPIVGISRVES